MKDDNRSSENSRKNAAGKNANAPRTGNGSKKTNEKKGFNIVDTFDDNFDGHILKTVRMSLNLTT